MKMSKQISGLIPDMSYSLGIVVSHKNTIK